MSASAVNSQTIAIPLSPATAAEPRGENGNLQHRPVANITEDVAKLRQDFMDRQKPSQILVAIGAIAAAIGLALLIIGVSTGNPIATVIGGILFGVGLLCISTTRVVQKEAREEYFGIARALATTEFRQFADAQGILLSAENVREFHALYQVQGRFDQSRKQLKKAQDWLQAELDLRLIQMRQKYASQSA